ncbi:uncharacterized protein LOC127360220 isoform X4 [Dicentrarchus labrax]|uniref:uncharacterized protein LOC127360220 isoform X4 n=1 Tax=Dicentrarchus labrax TaxID=13489 RepID=UPI0021F512AF|nr:uncharacterized protein LOC127360220 isoform X4 [Dicentrarchus labrax]
MSDLQMMIRFLFCYFLTAGISLGVQIHQSPSAVIGKAGGNVQLSCTHGQSNYRVMLWYQHTPGDRALKLIGYGYAQFSNNSVEEPFRKHFKLAGDLSGDNKNGSLSIINLKALEHSAVYFCAAREAHRDSGWFFTFNMMPSQLIVSIITLFWVRGVYLSKEKQVFQTPTELLVKPKDGVNLSLTHKIPSYDTVLWYQRSPGNTSLKLIGYVYYKTPTVESEFKIHFNVSGDGEKTAYLHILNPRHPEESGEYFGAARMYTVIKTVTLSYKNLHNDPAENSTPTGNHWNHLTVSKLFNWFIRIYLFVPFSIALK